MGDCLATRHLALGTLDIDMDPLVIAGGVGEFVDLLLRHRVPVAGADLLAGVGQQIGWAFDFKHRVAPLVYVSFNTSSRRRPGSTYQALRVGRGGSRPSG